MSDRVMLDPSLILDQASLVDLLLLAQEHALEGVAVPGSFREALRKDRFLSTVGRFYGLRGTSDPKLVDLFFQMTEGQIESYFASDTSGLFASVFESEAEGEVIAAMLDDEYSFLMNQSWLVAKVRKVFDKMIEGGAAALETSREAFDGLVRRSLKKDEDAPLTRNERLRALAKWSAVSGPSVLAFLEPVSGAAAGSLAGVFLLVDP